MNIFRRKSTGPVVYRGAGSAILPDFKGTKEDADRLIDTLLGKNNQPSDARPSEEEILMKAAWLWADRSTCSRLHVGAILTRDGRILSSGYNGSVRGAKNCFHEDDSPCRISVHAELNCLLYAGSCGVATKDCTVYCTHMPCLSCSQAMVNSQIKSVVYDLDYRDHSGVDLLTQANIDVRKYNAKS